ncbi:LamG domain-containing protein [Nonomuraea sp. NPDC049269]|uniref:LamG domain-containing protein n=1 Tax=Nonomuraea sp. NPDC049269 TaxID=3364349 RepID=UPI003721F733
MAVRFSASGQHYTATAGLPGNVYTFTAWVWSAAVGSRYRVVYWFRQTSGDHFSGVGVRDNPVDLQMMEDVSYWFSGVGPLAASAQTWYQVAAVVNGANATFYRSAAGDPLASVSVSNFAPPATPNQLWLGTDAFGGWWDGRIAAVKVWDAALSQADVEAELSQQQPKRTTNLIRWHPFVSAEPTDYSGLGNDLTGGTGATTEDGPPIPWGSAAPMLLLPAAGGAPANGTLSASLPPLSATINAAVTVSGTLAGTLPSLTAAATGASTAAGSLTAMLPPLTMVSSGAATASGVLTSSLPALTADVSASVEVAGQLDAALPALTGDLQASAKSTGMLAAGLPALSAVLSGAAGVSGTAGLSLPGLTASLAGDARVAGDATAVLPALSCTLTGQIVTPQGGLAATLPSLAAALAGTSDGVTPVGVQVLVGPPQLGWPVGVARSTWPVGGPTL